MKNKQTPSLSNTPARKNRYTAIADQHFPFEHHKHYARLKMALTAILLDARFDENNLPLPDDRLEVYMKREELENNPSHQ